MRKFSRAAVMPPPAAVRRGEYVTVVGPSGADKSTMLSLVGLLDETGTGDPDGTDGTDAGRTALRGMRIGFVFQSCQLLSHRTARENVELAMIHQQTPPAIRRQRAEAALRRVGLGHRLEVLPTRLSCGDRQRVAIARALAAEPALLLCDEPTGNLDSTAAAEILDLLDGLHRDGMTLVLITHDPEVARRGQRTITISGAVTAW